MKSKEEPCRGSGRGKLLLFGEYSALYGFPALGIPLSLETVISSCEKPGVHLPPGFRKYAQPFDEFLRFAETEFGISLHPERSGLSLVSTVPPGSGLGSSAALCSALAVYLRKRGLLEGSSEEDIWMTAHRLESFFHGTPSGIDTGLSLSEGPAAFRFEGNFLPHRVPVGHPDLPLVYGTVARETSAKILIRQVKDRMILKPEPTRQLINSLGLIGESAVEAFQNAEDGAELGLLARQAHDLLKSLHVSTEKIDSILALAAEAGSPGGKMSGAGGGGAFWFLAESREHAAELKELISGIFHCFLHVQ